MRHYLLLLAFLFASSLLPAQFTKYIVTLKDKSATTFTLSNPAPYLSQRAIARRTQYNISIDSSDLPVPTSYLAQVGAIPNVTILNTSRWLNAICIQTTDANAIASINALSFVNAVSGVAARELGTSPEIYREELTGFPSNSHRQAKQEADYFNYGNTSFSEIHIHQGEFLHNVGLRGQGMQIAMLDGGFYNYTSLRSFDSINLNGQVLGTWDFVAGNASVTEDNSHGMMCLSTIAANIPGQFIGKAPKASFYLFRTEDVDSEYPIEEFNWAAGAERADSSGADIISTSLGYGYQFNFPVPDYPFSDLNGDITMSARAADLAAKKGRMVFCSAGNSGNDYWKRIVTPADGDSVVAVGAVNTAGLVASFSSYGPSADGRVKPDLASVGVSALVQATSNTIGAANGTSFACPNMAGLGTCLWQGFPEFNNMRIVRAMKEAGSIYANPNDRIGYGIPDMKKAFSSLLIDFSTASVAESNCNAIIDWTSKDVSAMRYEIQRKAPGENAFTTVNEIIPLPGEILTNHHYSFSNSLLNIDAGTVSYRIRQIIDTAAASFTAIYLDTVQVAFNGTCTGNAPPAVRVGPNPTNSTTPAILLIETPNAVAQLSIYVYDVNGKLVFQYRKSKDAGVSTTELPVARLAAGKYLVVAFDGQKKIGKAEFTKL